MVDVTFCEKNCTTYYAALVTTLCGWRASRNNDLYKVFRVVQNVDILQIFVSWTSKSFQYGIFETFSLLQEHTE